MIEIKSLSKEFENKKLFRHFNCVIKENELIAITGASGSGKSTLLNIIGLLDSKYIGDVFIHEVNIKKLSMSKKSKFIRNNISYLFQNYALIEDETVFYNLNLALEYSKKSKNNKKIMIKNALKDVGLEKEMYSKIYSLSGGEAQRVALARAILKPSNIVLADEPTGNLDEINRDIVINILKKIHALGKIVIIVTHDLNVASKCERIINL